MFVALPKVLQGKPLSCLFEDKLNEPSPFEVWKSKSRTKVEATDIDESRNKISIQDAEFVINKPKKGGFKFSLILLLFLPNVCQP